MCVCMYENKKLAPCVFIYACTNTKSPVLVHRVFISACSKPQYSHVIYYNLSMYANKVLARCIFIYACIETKYPCVVYSCVHVWKQSTCTLCIHLCMHRNKVKPNVTQHFWRCTWIFATVLKPPTPHQPSALPSFSLKTRQHSAPEGRRLTAPEELVPEHGANLSDGCVVCPGARPMQNALIQVVEAAFKRQWAHVHAYMRWNARLQAVHESGLQNFFLLVGKLTIVKHISTTIL